MKEYAIRDYAVIGNCETAALVNPDGGIDWLCLPSFDHPSFFGALLSRVDGGVFSVRPVGEYRVARRYAEDTAILETRFDTETGRVLLTDFFVTARKRRARFYDFTSLEPTRKLVRTIAIEGDGHAVVEIVVAARPDYARKKAAWRAVEGGIECGDATLYSSVTMKESDQDWRARIELRQGEPQYLVLDYSATRPRPDWRTVEGWRRLTKAFWDEWNLFNYYRGPRQRIVRRSAVTLKLLTHAPSGAIVAAPTTSLPERPGGDLNWDYRFTWVRDTALVIDTLFRLGYSGEAKAYFEYLTAMHAEPDGGGRAGDLALLLPVHENASLDEEILEHLPGYRASPPVRRGNRAHSQLQLDIYGHFLQSLYFWRRAGGKINGTKRSLAHNALNTLGRKWPEPDNGIWESSERRQHTYSKSSAWLAFQRAADLGLMSQKEAAALCRHIHEQTLSRGVVEVNGRAFLAEQYEGRTVDATALLASTNGFLPDALARSTREVIERRLCDWPWVYRSERHRASGEGAFVLCSFWMVGELIRERKLDEAESMLDEVIGSTSSLGLLSEEISPCSGEFLGNYPQGFSHLGLITAVLNLEQAKSDGHFAELTDEEKFWHSVGRTIGVRGMLAGFVRVPQTANLWLSARSKWEH